MKKWFLILCLFLFLFPNTAKASPELAQSAQAAILMDQTTGRILYAKNAEKRMKIASLTKIMTAILAIEQGNLHTKVKIGPRSVGIEGSSLYLKEGEEIPLESLLYGLMLRSGNDSALAIAEHIGGSVEGFVYLMNQKAKYLGLENTHFENPHGLDHLHHYSTAKDLATLTAYALRHPVFREIVKTQVKTVAWSNGEKRKLYNKNRLLRLYPWADGIKTGYTKQARRTLVTSATKNGMQLISVTLNDGNDWNDAMDMFNYGFSKYQLQSIPQQGEMIRKTGIRDRKGRQLYLVSGKSLSYPLSQEERKEVVIKPMITLPLHTVQKDGVSVGSLRIYLNNELIGSVPLLSKFQQETSILDSWNQVLTYAFRQGGAE